MEESEPKHSSSGKRNNTSRNARRKLSSDPISISEHQQIMDNSEHQEEPSEQKNITSPAPPVQPQSPIADNQNTTANSVPLSPTNTAAKPQAADSESKPAETLPPPDLVAARIKLLTALGLTPDYLVATGLLDRPTLLSLLGVGFGNN